MVVQYSYITWTPPRLAPEEALELGRQIAIRGRETFITEFRQSMGKCKPQQAKQLEKTTPARYIFNICILVLVLFGLFTMPGREWGRMFVLILIFSAVYGISAWFAYRRFCKWVDYLVANYAAHVARGGK